MDDIGNYCEWVSFDEVWNLLIQKFNDSKDILSILRYPYGPNIDAINRFLWSEFPNDVEAIQISGWEEYISGNTDFENSYFTNLLFGESGLKEYDYFYIIIDKCFMRKNVLKVNANQLFKFIDESPVLIDSSVFQGSDVLFISSNKFTISFINHDGYYLSIKQFTDILKTKNHSV